MKLRAAIRGLFGRQKNTKSGRPQTEIRKAREVEQTEAEKAREIEQLVQAGIAARDQFPPL